MRELGGEAVAARARGQRLHEVPIDRRGTERRVVVLPRERERIGHAGV